MATRLKPEELTTKKLRGMYNMAYADYLIKANRGKDAVTYLSQAVNAAGGVQKTRGRCLERFLPHEIQCPHQAERGVYGHEH